MQLSSLSRWYSTFKTLKIGSRVWAKSPYTLLDILNGLTFSVWPYPTLPYQQLLSLSYTASIPIPIEIGPKRLRAETIQGRNDSPTWAETTHPKNWPKRPRPKRPGRNDPGPKRPGFTTCIYAPLISSFCLCATVFCQISLLTCIQNV